MNQTTEEPIGRRHFMERAILGIFGALGLMLSAPIIGYILSPIFRVREDLAQSTRWAPIASLAEMESIGDLPRMFQVPYFVKEGWRTRETSRPLFAVKKGGKLVLFSSFCTHLGCPTGWDEAKRMIICPCHGGLYNNFGEVIGGPRPGTWRRLNIRWRTGWSI
ncbi:MAG: Rieske 2Fe-2S domain-containing protein [Candidatus Manganitrophus sp.]|nr:MAG: Rieske 2Fe-2S domain-containing protein [Candidatus Manganitrophus sp.]